MRLSLLTNYCSFLLSVRPHNFFPLECRTHFHYCIICKYLTISMSNCLPHCSIEPPSFSLSHAGWADGSLLRPLSTQTCRYSYGPKADIRMHLTPPRFEPKLPM